MKVLHTFHGNAGKLLFNIHVCPFYILSFVTAILVDENMQQCNFIKPGVFSTVVEQPISAQIRAVADLCKYKYKNIFFRGR